MIVEIIKVDWFLGQDPNEGTVTFKTESGGEVEAFSYDENYTVGEKIEVELSILDYDMELETNFSNNPNKEKKLVKGQNDWEYEAYGQIKSIKPVIVDFGAIELDTGNWTNDEKVIGEFIYWYISRLDISRK